MSATEQQVEIAAGMYECRKTARFILGDRFRPKMEELAVVVDAVAKRDKCDVIVAGATVIKDGELEGMGALLLMAAIVEIVEPSINYDIPLRDPYMQTVAEIES